MGYVAGQPGGGLRDGHGTLMHLMQCVIFLNSQYQTTFTIVKKRKTIFSPKRPDKGGAGGDVRRLQDPKQLRDIQSNALKKETC